MTAVLVEAQSYQVVKAEIVKNKVEGLSFRNFFGMMSYVDYLAFEADVIAGRRSLEGAYEIS